MGKTWQLTSVALKWVKDGHPVFFISLRNGLNNSFRTIFGRNVADFEYFIHKLDHQMSSPVILILDGYDEMRENLEKAELITYLLGVLKKVRNFKMVLSCRTAVWLQDRYTQHGEHPNIKATVYQNNREDYSLIVDYFSDDELKKVLPKYQRRFIKSGESFKQIEDWPLELKELAHSPIWLRFIFQMFGRGMRPDSDMLSLFDFYFDRMGADDELLSAISKVAEFLIKNNTHLGSPIPSLALVSSPVEELQSMNIIRRVGRKEYKFYHPLFGAYGIARKVCSDLLQIQTCGEEEEKRKGERRLANLMSRIYEEYRPTVFTFIQQMIESNNLIIDKSLLQGLKIPISQLEDVDLTEQVVESLRKLVAANKTNIILLTDLKLMTNIPLKFLKKSIIDMLSNQRIRGRIDNKGTMDITDDELILEENWDEKHNQHIKMEKISRTISTMNREELENAKRELNTFYHIPEQSREELIKRIDEYIDHYVPLPAPTSDSAPDGERGYIPPISAPTSDSAPDSGRGYVPPISAPTPLIDSESIDASPAEEVIALVNSLEKQLNRIIREGYHDSTHDKLDGLSTKIKELIPVVAKPVKHRLRALERKVNKTKETCRLSDYHGVEMIKRDADVLKELEEILGEEIPERENLSWSSFGFVLKDRAIISLALADKDIEKIPESLEQLTNIRYLWMEGNELTSVPLSICNLPNIETLDLSYNRITYVPNDIENMKRLEALYLYKNKISTLPRGIGGLVNSEP